MRYSYISALFVILHYFSCIHLIAAFHSPSTPSTTTPLSLSKPGKAKLVVQC